MPTQFDRVFPSKGRIKFDGGLNNKFDTQLIADNESADCLNVVFGTDSVETRGGTEKVNTTPVGSFTGEGLYTRHDNSGAQTMCAWWNGTMYTLGGTTFTTVPSAQSVYTSGERVASAEYENYRFFCNGYSTPYKYNGTNFTRHGAYPPLTAPTGVSNNAGGSLIGDYQWKITYVNSALVQSDVGSASVTNVATALGESIEVAIPVAPASYGCDTRHLYRTETSGTTFKRVATINNNTDTTYVDDIADASLGVSAPTDQGVPPNYSAIVYHKDRLFVTDPANQNYVWYSELTDPYVFKATNFVRAGDNTGDLIRGFQVFDDGIVVFCDNSQWIIYMPDTTPGNWTVIKTRSPFGCKSPFGAFGYNGKVMFPALQNSKMVGFAALSGNAVDPDASLTTVSVIANDLKSNRIEPDIFEIQEGYLDRITSFVFKNKAYISVPYGTGQTSNNRIYVWDFSIGDLRKSQEGSWVPWTGLQAEQFCEYDGDLYYQSSDDVGFVYQMNSSTYSDDGTAINSYYWTKEFSGLGGDENWHKDFRKISTLYEKSGDYYMDFGYKVNSDTGVGRTVQIDLNPGGSLWGTMRYGSDEWGGGTDEGEDQVFLGQTRGKRIQFKFGNQNKADQKFKILGLRFIYNKKGVR